MPTNIFDTILANGIRAGQIPARQNAAREWYRAKARGTVVSPESLIKEEKARYRNTITIGKMYLFQYDPKHKATLPYYDTFPVIFPVDLAEGGFYGLNLHYLPIKLRAQLMNALYQLSSNTKYDDKTKLRNIVFLSRHSNIILRTMFVLDSLKLRLVNGILLLFFRYRDFKKHHNQRYGQIVEN
jgi:hypothetical protein